MVLLAFTVQQQEHRSRDNAGEALIELAPAHTNLCSDCCQHSGHGLNASGVADQLNTCRAAVQKHAEEGCTCQEGHLHQGG